MGWLGEGGLRLEECREDHAIVLRVELPGVDPERDVDITLEGDLLTITAERQEAGDGTGEPYRSEFRYGRFMRAVTLPPGVAPTGISARYSRGILEVRVEVPGGDALRVTHVPVHHEDQGDS